jgi:putative ABC transport system substrate-binding protein
MRRRDFTAALSAAAAWPVTARAQRAPGRAWRIGVLINQSAPHPISDILRSELRGRGHLEGQHVMFEIRYAEGRRDRVEAFATELVRIGVDIIVAVQTPAARAAKAATQTIPIVMAGVGAPLETGLVSSLNRPGGNITGVTDMAAELGGKRLQLLQDIIPNLGAVAALGSAHDLFTQPFLGYLRSAAAASGIRLLPFVVDGPGDFEKAFAAMAEAKAQAVIVQGIFNVNRADFLPLAARHRLPVVNWDRATVVAGGLFALSAKATEVYRRASDFVERILRGARPADLPVEQPTSFELIINMKTARAFGLTIPSSVAIQADEVIE